MSNFVNALRWSVGAELAAKVVPALVFVTLAKILIPSDFGIVAAALMIISFSQVLGEGGMAKALIQRQTDIDAAANAAFWINMALGVVIAGIVFAAAPAIATTLFGDERVSAVLQVMTLQILLASLASTQTALIQKTMDFGRLFYLRLIATTIPGLISIPLSLAGFSYWALVCGALCGQLGQVIVLWRISKWRPRLAFDRSVAGDLLGFGRWIVLSGFLTWFYQWADSFIVGMYLGTRDLGLYQTGSQLVTMAYGLVFSPLLPVLYSHLAGRDRDTVRDTLLKVLRFISPLSFSLAFVLLALAQLIERSLFSDNWGGLGLVLAILGVVQGISWTVGANGEAYRALNKPEYETYVMGISTILFLPAYLIAISFGFHTFLWVRLILVFPGLLLHQYFCSQVVGVRFSDSWPMIGRGILIGACGAVVGMTITLLSSGLPEFMRLMLGSAGAIVAVAVAWHVVDGDGLSLFFRKIAVAPR